MAEETGEIVSAMLVIETIVEPPASANQKPRRIPALELGAYAAPRSGGLWAELRDEISAAPPRPAAPPRSARDRSASS